MPPPMTRTDGTARPAPISVIAASPAHFQRKIKTASSAATTADADRQPAIAAASARPILGDGLRRQADAGRASPRRAGRRCERHAPASPAASAAARSNSGRGRPLPAPAGRAVRDCPRSSGSPPARMRSTWRSKSRSSERATRFDHHHGLLQHQQFRPRLHVEQLRVTSNSSVSSLAIEMSRAGSARVDRLADRTQRLREILGPPARRRIPTGLLICTSAMRRIVAADEAVRDSAREAPLGEAEPSHDAEIDRHHVAGRVDEQTALMHVGAWKKPSPHGVAQEGLHQPPGDQLRSWPAAAIPSGSDSLMPSIHSSVSTSRAVCAQCTFGNAEGARADVPAVRSAISDGLPQPEPDRDPSPSDKAGRARMIDDRDRLFP